MLLPSALVVPLPQLSPLLSPSLTLNHPLLLRNLLTAIASFCPRLSSLLIQSSSVFPEVSFIPLPSFLHVSLTALLPPLCSHSSLPSSLTSIVLPPIPPPLYLSSPHRVFVGGVYSVDKWQMTITWRGQR